ncbi:MAG: anti-sigma regulatory factor [Catenulispora sp.]|nr:anti-sigma regulatory factor [Catenulispora sp.]
MDSEPRSARTIPATDADTVLIRVPPDPDYLPVIRSASAHVGTKLGCTLAEVSDLRLAVDEACGLLLRHTVRDPQAGAEGDLECRFVLEGPALRVLLSVPARDAAQPEDDEFGWTILTALVDDFVWRVEDSTVHVQILKRRAGGR